MCERCKKGLLIVLFVQVDVCYAGKKWRLMIICSFIVFLQVIFGSKLLWNLDSLGFPQDLLGIYSPQILVVICRGEVEFFGLRTYGGSLFMLVRLVGEEHENFWQLEDSLDDCWEKIKGFNVFEECEVYIVLGLRLV